MIEKFKLNDSFLTSISGGYLPDNWQSMADEEIAEFKSYTDEQIATTGYQHNAEGLHDSRTISASIIDLVNT